MILQSLVDLYERRRDAEDPDQRLPEPGWQEKEVVFVIESGAGRSPGRRACYRVTLDGVEVTETMTRVSLGG